MTGAVFAPSLPPPCHPRPFLRFFLAPTTPKRRENNKGEGEEDLLPSPPPIPSPVTHFNLWTGYNGGDLNADLDKRIFISLGGTVTR